MKQFPIWLFHLVCPTWYMPGFRHVLKNIGVLSAEGILLRPLHEIRYYDGYIWTIFLSY